MSPDTIHGAVARRTAAAPDAVAIVHGEERVTYADLDRASNAHAAALRARGVRPGDFVPVLLPRGPRLIAVLLGVLKTGAAYAALDRRWPRPRVDTVTAALGARLVVDEDWDCSAAGSTGFTPVAVSPADAASVFFTSGSTGEPKGVVSPHRGATRLFGAAYADFGGGVLQAAPVPWDAHTIEVWGPLTSGGTVVVAEGDYLMPDDLRAAVKDGADTAFLTTSLFNLFVAEDPGCFTGLRQLLTGGEAASVPAFAGFLAAHPGIALVHCYGPVEATGFTTAHRITPADLDVPTGIPIGSPVPETGVHVLDGEICVSGAGLALGYLGHDDLTATAFPTVDIDGRPTRVYRTGDHGFLDGDGVLHFQGRRDRQVKIAGHRIEPGEVEAAVRGVPGVRECAALPVPDAHGGHSTLALFYLADDGGPEPRALRRELTARLPRYLVPGVIRREDALPLNTNGKLDRARLLDALTAQARQE